LIEENDMSMKKSFVWVSVAAMALLTGVAQRQAFAQAPASADTQSVDKDVDLLRKDIRSQKKQLIAANLTLTDAEATKFWPLYDQYTAELVKINDAKYAAIKEYATNYDAITDEKALSLLKQVTGVDQSVAQLRLKYTPLFAKVVSGKKTAMFFQIDRRLLMLIDLQLAASTPIIQP
jgi:Spy/CpxP family protein refolding chaperone